MANDQLTTDTRALPPKYGPVDPKFVKTQYLNEETDAKVKAMAPKMKELLRGCGITEEDSETLVFAFLEGYETWISGWGFNDV